MDRTTNHDLIEMPGHKTQLHRRVEARLGEMEAALAHLGGDTGHERQIRDIRTAMESGRGFISGGWEHVGQMEAVQLSHWLDRTMYLAPAAGMA